VPEIANGSNSRIPDGRDREEIAQLPNANMSIAASWESDANVTTERDLQPSKQKPPSRPTAEGMQIDESDEQRENARGARRDSREQGSKMTAERDRHSRKPVRCSTDAGTKNDESDGQFVKAHSSIDKMREPASNVTADKDPQEAKQ
jgi:hypothetical protein